MLPEFSASQMCKENAHGTVNTTHLLLEWTEASWDSTVFGFPVLQINQMRICGPLANKDFCSFETARDRIEAGLVSCRLPHQCLSESFLLEERGFRFIEMVFQPELDDLQTKNYSQVENIQISFADHKTLDTVIEIAGKAFRNERFYIDPRLNSILSDLRYCNWVRDSFNHPTQQIYVFNNGDRIVAFFIIEILEDGTCYWHLTAVDPNLQSQGFGRSVWLAMLNFLRARGVNKVRTCIAARNHRILNLYASLGFRYPPPLMTFHWVRVAKI